MKSVEQRLNRLENMTTEGVGILKDFRTRTSYYGLECVYNDDGVSMLEELGNPTLEEYIVMYNKGLVK